MKKNTVSLEQLVEQLVTVFTTPGKLATYNSDHEQYTMLCGWTGGMNAPESRPAYIRTFGAVALEAAEDRARKEIDDRRTAYQGSEWAVYEQQANDNMLAGSPVPSELSHVWGMCSNLKCDGGRGYQDEIRHQELYCEKAITPHMLHIKRVFNVSAEELNRPELADELAKAERLPGGGWLEDDERLKSMAPYYLSCVEVAMVTDGTRYYFIDSEGYDYARYIFLPLTARDMFPAEFEAVRAEDKARKEKEQAEQEAEHAARLADYRARCDKWAKLMRPVAKLEEAQKGLNYGTPEYKAAARALNSARRANILTMCRAAFPGVKFSLKRNDGWGASWELTYTDGPTEEAFGEAVDLELFQTYRDTFNGWDDSTDTIHTADEFCTFARAYMGSSCTGGIGIERKMSDTVRDELRTRVLAVMPELADGSGVYWEKLTPAQLDAFHQVTGEHFGGRSWLSVDGAMITIFDGTDYSQPTTAEATEPVQDTTTATAAPATDTTTDEAPAEGLTLIITEGHGVAVVGDSRTTYRNRKAIKAHGATWNKAAQQWQATDPEAVQRLREWFGVADTPTTETTDTEAEPTATPDEDTPDTMTDAQPATIVQEAPTTDESEPTDGDTARDQLAALSAQYADTLNALQEVGDRLTALAADYQPGGMIPKYADTLENARLVAARLLAQMDGYITQAATAPPTSTATA